MSNLIIDFDWEDPAGAKGKELRASWARLSIRVGDNKVTEVLDRRAGSIQGNTIDLPPLRSLRRSTAPIDFQRAPWKEGYERARQIRARLKLGNRLLKSRKDFASAFGLDEKNLGQAVMGGLNGGRAYDALVGVNQLRSPAFVIRKQRKDSRRFALCRGLFDYLTSGEDAPRMVSRAHSENQKRNRAFATELLVPANLLKQRLGSDIAGEEEIEDLAAEFGVSSYVILHQIENHGLATLAT